MMEFFAQDSAFNPLWRKRCVLGCSTETPACPTCPDGQKCTLVSPSCDACQTTICVASSSSSSSSDTHSEPSDSGSRAGAIAGGVVGGLLAIAAITYCVWRFCIKPKRGQYQQDTWTDNNATLPGEKDISSRRDARASTHTVGSVASTVLTTASNVIQIAYIPGVTNRGSTPLTPGLLVPPVPQIPIALSTAEGAPQYEQEHFFMPGDLRDSTYSDQASYARNSVASTIYGKNAIISPVPAQTVLRGKAAVVSVPRTGNGDLAPPVPDVNFGRYDRGRTPSPAFSVGSTFLNNASATTVTKPSVIKLSTLKSESDSAAEFHGPIAIASSPTSRRQGPFVDPSSSGPPVTTYSLDLVLRKPKEDTSGIPELATPSSRQVFEIPSLLELETPRSKTSLEANLPELDSPRSGTPRSNRTPFGDENEIQK